MDTSKLVDTNIKFAKFLARKYSNGDNFDDILQETLIGFFEASQKFDSQKGKFTTIAQLYAKNRIFKYLAKNKYQIGLPYNKFINNTTERDLIFNSDNFISKDSELFVDFPETKEVFCRKDYKTIINNYIKKLTPKEQIVIKLVLGINSMPKSDGEIALITKNSKDRINYIKNCAIKKLSCLIQKKQVFCAEESGQSLSHEDLRQKLLNLKGKQCQN